MGNLPSLGGWALNAALLKNVYFQGLEHTAVKLIPLLFLPHLGIDNRLPLKLPRRLLEQENKCCVNFPMPLTKGELLQKRVEGQDLNLSRCVHIWQLVAMESQTDLLRVRNKWVIFLVASTSVVAGPWSFPIHLKELEMVALGGCGGRGVLAGREKQSGKQDESFKVARFHQL